MSKGRVTALVVVLLLAAGAGTVVFLGGAKAAYYTVRYPADEDAFARYVTDSIGRGYYDSSRPDEGAVDRRWVLAHPDEVLGAGRAACGWLGTQPRAGRVEPSGGFTFAAVADRYLTTPTPLDDVVSASGRSVVVAGAWEHLCRAERERRTAPRSHPPD